MLGLLNLDVYEKMYNITLKEKYINANAINLIQEIFFSKVL